MFRSLEKLREVGYRVFLDGYNLRLEWAGEDKPDPVAVAPLLNELKESKANIIRYLQEGVVNYPGDAGKARRLLQERGWCAVRSKVLGEVVIWIRDNLVSVPDKWKDAERYTEAELSALAAKPRITAEELRAIHAAKKLFGGCVEELRMSKLPERFDEIFRSAMDELTHIYSDGTLECARDKHRDLYDEINRTEKQIHEVWEKGLRGRTSFADFKQAVKLWGYLNKKAIELFIGR